MKENSIEKDEEILNNIKAYMQENIDKGYHKFVYNNLGYDEKCVDVINAIEHILSDYKRVLKENKTLNERNQYLVKYRAKLEKELYESNENYIPVSLVEEKIEELENQMEKDKVDDFGIHSIGWSILDYIVECLKSLLQEGDDK